MVQDELDYRKSRLTETRFKASGLTERPTLTEFDWGFNPNLPKKAIYELVSGKFIRDGHDALLIGSPGTGKSHIAKTVANAAILSGYKVLYREAHIFFEDLFEATQLKRRKKVTRKSTLLTSNRPIEDWGKLLRDNAASSAILDRLLHRGHLLNFKGKSYRLKEAASRLSEIKRKNQDEKGKTMDFYPQD